MKNYILIIIGILLVSCKQKETTKATTTEQNSTTELDVTPKNSMEDAVSKSEQYFENDSLLKLLEADLDKIVLSPKLESKLTLETNPHDENVKDTIKTLTFDNTKIYSYLAANQEVIYAATIANAEFKFLDSIGIGTKKESFERLIKTKINADILSIGNEEQMSVFSFVFENGMVKEIAYEAYLD